MRACWLLASILLLGLADSLELGNIDRGAGAALRGQGRPQVRKRTRPARKLEAVKTRFDPRKPRGPGSKYCTTRPPARLVVGACHTVRAELCKPSGSRMSWGAVAGSKHDTQWLNDLGLPYLVYQMQDPEKPYYFPPVAHEAAAYVQYILDHFQCLPDVSPARSLLKQFEVSRQRLWLWNPSLCRSLRRDWCS